jgi:hypothetical protein
MSIVKDKKSIADLGSSLTIKVPYSADLNFPLEEALKLAKENLPRTKEIIKGLNQIKTSPELENFLKSSNLTLIVEKNFAEDFEKFLNIEAIVSKNVESEMDDSCPLLIPTFSKEEVDNIIDSCEVAFEPADSGIDIDQLKNELNSDEPLKQKNELESCLAEIDQITERIKYLVEEEKKANTIKFELEESEWFFVIASEYYREREKVVKSYLGLFQPLLEQKKKLEEELKVAPNKLVHFQKGAGTGSKYDKTDDTTPTDVGDVIIGDEKHPIRVKLENDLEAVKNTLKYDKDQTPQFDTSIGDNELRNKLADLFGAGNVGFSLQNKISAFADTNRIQVGVPAPANNSNFSVSFSLIIDSPIFRNFRNGNTKIDETLLEKTSVKKGEFQSNLKDMFVPGRISFSDKNPNTIVHGILYDKFYNIMGNPNLFFSDAERGSSSSTPPKILNQQVFEDFWTNFEPKLEEKKLYVKTNVVKPVHDEILQELRKLAKSESIWLLTYGRVFENLLSEDSGDKLRDVVSKVENVFLTVDKNRTANKRSIDIIDLYRKRIKEEINIQKNKYSEVKCANNPEGPPINIPPAGSDPLGKVTYKKGNNPQHPDPTKYCYWKEFAKLATIINILPIPSNKPLPPNLFRYWPVGLIVPSPSGPFNVPLPIIWFALATIPTPLGIFVIFLGQCGILPCPFVLWISVDGEAKFIATLKGKKNIVSVTGVASNTLPPIKITTGTLKLTTKAINLDKDGNPIKNSIPEYDEMENPDSHSSSIKDIFDRVMKKINKLENPDFSKLSEMRGLEKAIDKAKKNGYEIPKDFGIDEKVKAVEDSVVKLFSKIQFDDICFPKNTEKLNPKPTIVEKVIDTISKAKDLRLPGLTIPAQEEIDLKDKLLKQFESDPSLKEKVSLDGLSPEDKEKKKKDLKEKIKLINAKASENLKKPEVLGVVAAVATGASVNFFNPFVCSPSSDGAKIPPIPGPVFTGIAVLATSIPIAIDLLKDGDINGKSIEEILRSTIDKVIPSLRVPNPSNLSIKHFAVNTGAKLALFSKPPIPNPGPIVRKICIPGGLIKAALEAAILAGISAGLIKLLLQGGHAGVNPDGSGDNTGGFLTNSQIQDIINHACDDVIHSNNSTGNSASGANSPVPLAIKNLEIKIRNLNPSDIKQLLVTLIEGSLKNLEKVLLPLLTAISLLQAFPELNFFKLPVLEVNKGLTLVFEKQKLDIAFSELEKLSTVPFLAVAAGGEISRALHPLANTDDLPPWERLSIHNILFVVFLDQFCSAARSGGGFQENTLFPLPG